MDSGTYPQKLENNLVYIIEVVRILLMKSDDGQELRIYRRWFERSFRFALTWNLKFNGFDLQ